VYAGKERILERRRRENRSEREGERRDVS